MPRPKGSNPSDLSAGQAHYVLHRLAQDRRVLPGEITRYLGEMHREIHNLEARLNMLRAATTGMGGGMAPVKRGPGRPPRNPQMAAMGSAPITPAEPTAPAAPADPADPAAKAGAPAKGGKKRRTLNLTPERRAQLKLQGQFLSLIRQVPKTRRAQYKKVLKDRGREAAIKALRDHLK